MTRINLFGWLVLGVAISAMGAMQVGCCGGSSSASEDWLTEAAEAAADSAASGASDGQVKTCNDVKSISQCSEHQGQAFAILGEDFYKGICELTDGSWGTDPCPTADIVGRCDDGDGSVTLYYSTGGSSYTAATAKEACDFTEGSFKG